MKLRKRLNGLNELDEFCLKAYESSSLYKEQMKKYHDQKIEKRDFFVGIWCFCSILGCFCFQANSSPNGLVPILITQLFPHGATELDNKEGASLKVNEQRIKIYQRHTIIKTIASKLSN